MPSKSVVGDAIRAAEWGFEFLPDDFDWKPHGREMEGLARIDSANRGQFVVTGVAV